MKILVLNLYYPPDTSATAKIAAAFLEPLAAKHEVTLICGRPSYDPTEKRPWRLWQSERLRGITVIRVGSTDYPRTQMPRRVLNYLTYVALSIPRALFVRSDLILAMTDPPFEGIVGGFVAMLKLQPFVYNIRDLYPDMALGGSIVEPGPLARIWEVFHRWALRRATRIIVLGEDMRARIISKGVPSERVAIVRDGVELAPTSSSAPERDAEVIRTIRSDYRFVLLHAGNLGFYGAWETLLAAARELAEDGVSLVFIGDGALRPRLEAAAANSPNVRFLPFFPADKLASVLAAADAHVVTVKRGLEGVVVPSKLYGILAAGRPIVAVAPEETDAASLAARDGFGVSADPDNPAELVAIVRTLLGDPARLAAMGSAARVAAARYARPKETLKFMQILEDANQP